ncbi:MAG: alpha/beta fold hydrolase [Vicinamibacterales bacterium]
MNMAKSGTVRANSQELYYEVHGEGQPLVLVMGIGYDSTLWTLAQVPALSKRFQVTIFDNRDVGRSSQAKSAYTIADMADDTAALMDALGVKKAHVCGLSMGGMIAMEFALRHPDRLDRLVLTGAPGAPARQVFHPIHTWNWVKANDKAGETFAAQQFVYLFSTSFLRNKDAVQQTIAMLSNNPNVVSPAAYDRQAKAFLQYDALDRLSAVKARTLCIVGEQDVLTPVHECHEVADKIPGAKFEVIKGDGSSHVVPIERPEDFNNLVMKFLS